MRSFCRAITRTCLLLLLVLVANHNRVSAQTAGFTTPYQTIDVATAESGTISTVAVKEGDRVEKGQVLAGLDEELQTVQLASAEFAMLMTGRVMVAQAELQLRTDRLSALQELRSRGSARDEEVVRAQADVEVAKGQLKGIQEELELRRQDYRLAMTRLKRRTIRAPISGVVTQLRKDAGEYVGPASPELMTIAQLDPILARFSVPSNQLQNLKVGRTVAVDFGGRMVKGTVDSVAPIIDGESGTVRVKVRIDNENGRLLCGEQCSLELSDIPVRPAQPTSSGRPRAGGVRPEGQTAVGVR